MDTPPYSPQASSWYPCAKWRDYRWEPHASCSVDLNTGAPGAYYEVCSWLAGHRILLVGDSVTTQMFESLLLLAGFAGGQKRFLGMWAFGDAMLCNQTAYVRYERSDSLQLVGERPPPNIHGVPQRTYSHLSSWSLLQKYDTVVLNTGIHIQQDSALRARIHLLAKKFAATPSNVTLVWRTTVPGHDNCTAATEPLPKTYVPSPNNRFGWDRVEGQNMLIQSIFERVAPGRLKYLDAFALANTRADGHLGVKSKFLTEANGKRVSTRVQDCLHYCLPGPIDIWNVLFTRLFLQPRRA